MRKRDVGLRLGILAWNKTSVPISYRFALRYTGYSSLFAIASVHFFDTYACAKELMFLSCARMKIFFYLLSIHSGLYTGETGGIPLEFEFKTSTEKYKNV